MSYLQNHTDFQFYFDHFNETLEGRETVGQICNILPYYKNTTGLDCTVLFQDAKNRPNVLMAKSDHELAKDFHNGISLQKAQKIASIAIHEYQDTFA